MKKVIIIGNSHAGTIGRALEGLPAGYLSSRNLAITVLAIKDAQDNLICEDGQLKPTNGDTSFYLHQQTGKYRIALSEFDIVVSYGGKLMANPDGWISHIEDMISNQFSMACLEQSHIDEIELTPSMKLLKSIKSDGSYTGKFVQVPSPVVNQEHWLIRTKKETLPDYMDFIEGIYRNYFHQLNTDIIFLPRDLLAPNGYSIASRYKKDVKGDFHHLNDDGGKLVATTLVNSIAS